MAETNMIDESLYSRQLYVLGEEAMKKMNASSALIIGMKGLGVEIAKNIILAGVKTIAIHDNEPAAIRDMTTNFYITEADIGKPRAEVCLPKLKELNPYVNVYRRVEDITEDFIKSFRVVVVTNMMNKEQEIINTICHKNNICFIGANTYGLAVRIFCDFGDSFTISDYDDSEPVSMLVGDISIDKEAIVTTAEERVPFQEGDMVTFSDIRGMTELNGCEPRRVHLLGNQQFTIGDTSAFSAYESFGWCTQVKLPRTLSFRSLSECNKQPGEMSITDFGKMDHAMNLHISVLALDLFVENRGHSPRPWNAEDAEEFVKYCKQVNASLAEEAHLSDLNESVLKTFAMTCCGAVCPITAAFGGIIAQEVLKACSNKFTPIHQFMYYDAFEALPERAEHEDCKEIGSRYDGQILLFGSALQKKLADSKIFLVGAGAIGCEMIKNLALMGVATEEGCLYVTDMDRIERSNLSRQFLFRNSDIGHSKSETAVRVIKQMNPAVKAIHYEVKVGPDTEDIFTDQFIEDLTAVCNALDNVEARQYMDSRCVRFDKPLLESGTLGTRGNTQIVVPFLTESYGSTQDPQGTILNLNLNIEESIPICTLKNFPYKIEHTIQWSRDLFEGLFAQSIDTLSKYKNNRDYLSTITDANLLNESLHQLHSLLIESPCTTLEDCIRWSINQFRDLFYTEICNITHQFPKDSVDANGNKFWSGHKLFPTATELDLTNSLHYAFVSSATMLKAATCGIPCAVTREEIQAVYATMQFKPFEFHSSEEKNSAEVIASIRAELAALPTPSIPSIPLEFEKDDDSNHHIDFIAACANLRAENYGITTADRNTIKKIAGKIIPAISTTTAFVTGAISLELLKIECELKAIESYRSCFANLSMPMFCFTEPGACEKYTLNGKEYSLWSHVVINKSCGLQTIGDLINYLDDMFGVETTMMTAGSMMIFMGFGAPAAVEKKKQENLSEKIRQMCSEEIERGEKYVMITLGTMDDDEIPAIYYEL